jgi:hypothetical protein
MENAMSWDGGVALGTEWKLWGMTIDATGAVETGQDMDEYGTGWVSYTTHYDGGQFWLSKDGDWGDNVTDLTGTMSNYTVNTTVTYYHGSLVGATSNISATGIFDNCPMGTSVIRFIIANASLDWHPAFGTPMPSDYPPFLCSATIGELFFVCCVIMEIDGAVPVDNRSWGAIKSLYR